MSRFSTSRSNARRWQVGIGVGVTVAVVGIGLSVASAEEIVPTVNCPAVPIAVAVPAQAQDEVQLNLQLLNAQIAEANTRLRNTVGQGGPDFIRNAILGPLADKRFATINRIETAIGRRAVKPDLNAEVLKTCTLNQNGGGSAAQPTVVPTSAPPADVPPATVPPTSAPPTAGAPGGSGAGVIRCPDVTITVAIPASAAAEVNSNLALLTTQIAEAQKRLEGSFGQGGPNFVQNAILGPLADKRFATINRIETAIGRSAVKPDLNAEGLKTCLVLK